MDISKLAKMENKDLEKLLATEDKKIATAKANKELIKRLILANSLSEKEDAKKVETPKTENTNNQPTQPTNVNPQNNQVNNQPTTKPAVGNSQNNQTPNHQNGTPQNMQNVNR